MLFSATIHGSEGSGRSTRARSFTEVGGLCAHDGQPGVISQRRDSGGKIAGLEEVVAVEGEQELTGRL